MEAFLPKNRKSLSSPRVVPVSATKTTSKAAEPEVIRGTVHDVSGQQSGVPGPFPPDTSHHRSASRDTTTPSPKQHVHFQDEWPLSPKSQPQHQQQSASHHQPVEPPYREHSTRPQQSDSMPPASQAPDTAPLHSGPIARMSADDTLLTKKEFCMRKIQQYDQHEKALQAKLMPLELQSRIIKLREEIRYVANCKRSFMQEIQRDSSDDGRRRMPSEQQVQGSAVPGTGRSSIVGANGCNHAVVETDWRYPLYSRKIIGPSYMDSSSAISP